MVRKILLGLAILVVMSAWPLSIFINPPRMELGLIWQMNDANQEKYLVFQKLGLETSRVKQIFYNTKTTILIDRYLHNILVLLNLNYYYFNNHPQVDVSDIDNRPKFPYPALLGLVAGFWYSIRNKKYLTMWSFGCLAVLLVSLFKNLDGWNLAVYPILGIITSKGLIEINKYRYGWAVLLSVVIIGLSEIGRLWQ